MNAVANKLLLARDEFMPEMHLGQPGFIDKACGSFTKNKEKIKKNSKKLEVQDVFFKMN